MVGFLEHWDAEVCEHFRREEELLVPLLARVGAVADERVCRLAREHAEIRDRVARIRESDERTVEAALGRELGQLLNQHVRFEERELFPWVESVLGTAELQRLAERLG